MKLRSHLFELKDKEELRAYHLLSKKSLRKRRTALPHFLFLALIVFVAGLSTLRVQSTPDSMAQLNSVLFGSAAQNNFSFQYVFTNPDGSAEGPYFAKLNSPIKFGPLKLSSNDPLSQNPAPIVIKNIYPATIYNITIKDGSKPPRSWFLPALDSNELRYLGQ